MLPGALWLLCLAAVDAFPQRDTTNPISISGTDTLSTISSIATSDFDNPSLYTYVTGDSQITVSSSTNSLTLNGTATTTGSSGTETGSDSSATASSTSSGSGSESQSERTSTTPDVTAIMGGAQPTTTTSATTTGDSGSNSTASSTTSSARASNTVPCNGHPEFCNRAYSNITQVCAHNSAFYIDNNAASNQELDIPTQLNDGVRMLQGEVHWVNDTLYSCHSSCDLLNAGTFQSELETIVNWVESHPYDVVTFLIVNSNYAKHVNVLNYTDAIEASGIRPYLYEPQYIPQHRDQWPTLGEMILSGKRVVMFMDYNANQTAVPYVLDEFSHIWETPFSPTNQSFPCTQQRPPNLPEDRARDQYMYMANHNLNFAIDLGMLTSGVSNEQILIPNTAELNQTNGAFDQYGMLGAMTENCT
ncbi:hypothetical protein B0A50_04465, partial [Salinomyces thailandicus]